MATTTSTPKRKREDEPWVSPIQFTFELDPLSFAFLSSTADSEDGSNSPRSRVAHKFRGLALESGGGAPVSSQHRDILPEMDESMRKRRRPDQIMGEADAQPAPTTVQGLVDLDGKSVMPSKEAPQASEIWVQAPEPHQHHTQKQLAGSLQHAYPSINRLSESRSRVKKRTGSPPLRMKRPSRRPFDDPDEEEVQIVDPVRAALTWHEDEITIYDPEDEDDDGVGINGIGFKPTAALAQARATKRKQQMAEYRKREESEARARRSQRRGCGSGVKFRSEEQPPPRKVRFTDTDGSNISITTG
ncbi:hypothetical protein FHETE_5450 [Fusarium heterosporum]|uniref:Uncharacterized protein n=1 Tax=Fusarium heterosporum TaxID=42747 RepID=A0A8H5T9L5_FUSHE|nr:hypothetical protein FHETE_5450 [Fusarium heterosporum]